MDKLRECPNPECRDNTDLAHCSNAVGVRVQCMSCGTMGPFVTGNNEPEATRLWNLIALPRPTGKGELVALEDVLAAIHNADLPEGFLWGRDAMEQFNFGKERAADAVRALPRHDGEAGRLRFQARVGDWMQACFGPTISADTMERNHRFLEESLELIQANHCTASEAHQLVDYVFGRPVGEPHQECGGVMVTLAALCLARGLDIDKAAEDELARVWTKIEKIRAKQAAKPNHGPLPGPARATLARKEQP